MVADSALAILNSAAPRPDILGMIAYDTPYWVNSLVPFSASHSLVANRICTGPQSSCFQSQLFSRQSRSCCLIIPEHPEYSRKVFRVRPTGAHYSDGLRSGIRCLQSFHLKRRHRTSCTIAPSFLLVSIRIFFQEEVRIVCHSSRTSKTSLERFFFMVFDAGRCRCRSVSSRGRRSVLE